MLASDSEGERDRRFEKSFEYSERSAWIASVLESELEETIELIST
jgi:hypothetical protein